MAAKPKEVFFVLNSDCGNFDQLEMFDSEPYKNITAAKEGQEDCDYDGTLYIVKVVAEGTSKGFNWK